MDKIQFVIEGDPRPLARARFNGRRCYQPSSNTDYRQVVQQSAKLAMGNTPPLSGAIGASIKLYRRFKPTAKIFGDVDNHLKAIFDALNKLVFDDDSQVVTCAVSKFCDKERPRTEISISKLPAEVNLKQF